MESGASKSRPCFHYKSEWCKLPFKVLGHDILIPEPPVKALYLNRVVPGIKG